MHLCVTRCAICRYFTCRFPNLLQVTYDFALQHCRTEPPLSSYFTHPPCSLTPAAATPEVLTTTTTETVTDASTTTKTVLQSATLTAVTEQVTDALVKITAAANTVSSGDTDGVAGFSGSVHAPMHEDVVRTAAWNSRSNAKQQHMQSLIVASSTTPASRPMLHQLPSSPDVNDVLGQSNDDSHPWIHESSSQSAMPMEGVKADDVCRHDSPASRVKQQPDQLGCLLGHLIKQPEHQAPVEQFPHGPRQPVCDFYARTGHCKFGQGCRFDHPLQLAVRLSRLGLPVRQQEPVCPHYAKTGECKYGPGCKFNHPEPPQNCL